MIDQALAKELKDAGFPLKKKYEQLGHWDGRYEDPTLSELIEVCGSAFDSLSYAHPGTEHPSNTAWLEKDGRWVADAVADDGTTTIADKAGHTPEEAVARLWLALHKK